MSDMKYCIGCDTELDKEKCCINNECPINGVQDVQ